MKLFKKQSFFSSASLCNKQNVDDEYIHCKDKGSLFINGAQYFIEISDMVKYSYNNFLIDMTKLTKKEQDIIKLELKMPNKITETFIKKLSSND